MITLLIWRIRCVQMSLQRAGRLHVEGRRCRQLMTISAAAPFMLLNSADKGQQRMEDWMLSFLRAQSGCQIFCLSDAEQNVGDSHVQMHLLPLPSVCMCVRLCGYTEVLLNSLWRQVLEQQDQCICLCCTMKNQSKNETKVQNLSFCLMVFTPR